MAVLQRMGHFLITLNDTEIKLAKHIGKYRHDNARNKGITDAKMGPQSNEVTDVDSAGAEIAFCKAYNLYPDLQFEVIPEHDATLHCGATVDVKQTSYRTGRLLATMKKNAHRCDIYVLLIGELPEYEIVGGMPAELFFHDKFLTDLGHGKGYAVQQKDLWSIDALIWRCEYDMARQA